MWFLSKQKKQKRPEKSSLPFLRKGLPPEQRHRIAEKEEPSRIGVGTIFLWMLFFGTLFYTAFFSVFFSIGEVRITGTGEISEKIVREFVDDRLTERYLRIFPRNNYFLAHPLDLESRLRQEYPLLATVSVTRVFPNSLSVSVTERKKIILWRAGDRQYLIDEEGRAHDGVRALLPENMPYVLLVTDTSGREVILGEKVFDPSYGTFILQMDELFKERIGLASDQPYTTVSRFAGELRVKTTEGWEAYFGTGIPIESSLNVLKLLFEKELPQELRTKLAYIDLRAENRAYYAFRDGENPKVVSPPVAVEVKKIEAESKKKKK